MPIARKDIELYIRIKWGIIASITCFILAEVFLGLSSFPAYFSALVALAIAAVTNLSVEFSTQQKDTPLPQLHYYLGADLFLIVAGLYLNGGIESTWLFLPVLLIFLVGYIYDTKASVAFATIAWLSFLVLTLLEYFKLIPHFTAYNISESFWRNLSHLAERLFAMLFLYFAGAVSSGSISRIIQETLSELNDSLKEAKAAHQESERSRENLIEMMDDLAKTKDTLEDKIKERTNELEHTKANLEKEVANRTFDLENSRKAILSMMKDLKDDMTKLQAIDRLKTEFLSMVSHELRTPITPIKGYLSLLLAGKMGALAEPQKGVLKILSRQSDHLQDLIESLLDISRLELGKPIPTKMGQVVMKNLIEEVAETLKVNLQSRNLQLKLEIKDPLPTILGDKIKLKRVLTNLIGNAIKFSPDGEEIKIQVSCKEGAIRVEVIDKGIGIAEENLEKIFEKFFQVDSPLNRSTGGIGMGLAIARELVELHGGKIWAESKGLEKGTKVIFTLPIRNAE